MKAIQAGILVCLLAITGLLFAIYRQGPAETPANEVVEQAPLAAVQAPVEAPEPEALPEPEPLPTPKPKPTMGRAVAAPGPAPRRPEPVKPAPAPEPALEIVDVVQPPPAVMETDTDTPPEIAEAVPEPGPALLYEETPIERPIEPRQPRVVTVPAGQSLTVRLDNTLSTSRNRPDDTFFATLDEPLIVDGLIIADRGARLEGRVVESEQAGRVKGLARLSCELTSLHTDDGQRVKIETSTFSLDGESSRNDDLKKVAVGAGAGAILGAIFGGGKGAAIGAASGAGAGAGAAAATRGEPAMIEPETRLDFRLSSDVTITEKL